MSDAAGHFDLQVNGYAGVDFHSDNLTADDLHRACAALRHDGVAHILLTITTDDVARMERRLRRVVSLRERDPIVASVVMGIHIEGPFISPIDGYRGAHPRDAVRPADGDSMNRLLDAAGGLTRLVTLAPEHDARFAVTRLVSSAGIRVSAGHTNAKLDELRGAIDAGLTMFTHLGNGCPMQMHRHDNIIQRALSLSDRLWLMFIADGAHVPFAALSNYLKVAGLERSIVVTDAVTPAGMGMATFQIGRWVVRIGSDLVARAPDGSHLIGSAMTMPDVMKRLTDDVGLSREDAVRVTAENPRRAIVGI